MIIFEMLARKDAHTINALLKNIQTKIDKKDNVMPVNKFERYIYWCLDSFNNLILIAFLGTAKYIVSIVSSTPMKEDETDTINDIFSLSSKNMFVFLWTIKHTKKTNVGKIKFE